MKQLWTYPELLRSRRFWGYALCMASSSGSFYAFLGGAPLVAAAVFQMSPAMLGFAMGTMTAGFMLGSFLAGRFGPYFALTSLMIAGRLVACRGPVLGLALMPLGIMQAGQGFGSVGLGGLGNGLSIP